MRRIRTLRSLPVETEAARCASSSLPLLRGLRGRICGHGPLRSPQGGRGALRGRQANWSRVLRTLSTISSMWLRSAMNGGAMMPLSPVNLMWQPFQNRAF